MSGCVTLSRYPYPRLRVACDRCKRYGDYSRARLIERYGPDFGLPALKAELTADCPGDGHYSFKICVAIFPDLRRDWNESSKRAPYED